MEFTDRSTGYVLFRNCRRPCPATLYGTVDGGVTWQHLPLDLDGADAQSLTVADPMKLAVRTVWGKYHISRDGGHSFVEAAAYPADFAAPRDTKANLQCQYRDDDGACQRYEVARGGDLVPVQPPLPAGADEVDAVTDDATGRIWVVTAVRGTVYTAVSSDGGASWRSLPDLDTGLRLDPVELTAAPDDREPWLVVGDSGSPRLWAYRGGPERWRGVVEGQPAHADWTRAVSAGGGALAICGGLRLSLVFDDGTVRAARPTDAVGTSRLADGSLLAATPSFQGVWLGTRDGDDFAWANVTVEPA
jgi:photosystem II stability/assembly factor-like uncharacterized protein